MLEKYHILKATAAGDPYKTSHGSELQGYFVNVEGHEGKTIMVNRKVGNSAPSGVVWGEMEELTSKKGKPYYKLSLKPAPDGEQSYSVPSQTSPEAAGDVLGLNQSSTRVSWGQALIAASMIAKSQDLDEILALANSLYRSAPEEVETRVAESRAGRAEEADYLPTAADVDQINLEDIPF